jgi:hypothetical protein
VVLVVKVVDVDVLEAAEVKRLADDPEWQFVKPINVAAYSDGDALLVLLAAFELSGGKRVVGLHKVEKPSFIHVVYVSKCILVQDCADAWQGLFDDLRVRITTLPKSTVRPYLMPLREFGQPSTRELEFWRIRMQPLQELGSLLADHLPADVDISLVRLHPLRQCFIHILIHDRSPGFGVPIYSFLPCQQLRRTLQSVANCRLRHCHLVNLLQPLHQGPLTKGWVVLLISIEGNAKGLRQMATDWFGGLRHCWLLLKKKNGSCPTFMHKYCNKVNLEVFVFARQLSYCTYMGIQFEAKTGRSSIFQNVP